ncbi:MAG TPA: hypothetical protein VK978_05175 [Candidatus Saccharimonadales bacterium]|nr:hypothetical protein [Candidatus Saccharimonadales bacterium]
MANDQQSQFPLDGYDEIVRERLQRARCRDRRDVNNDGDKACRSLIAKLIELGD